MRRKFKSAVNHPPKTLNSSAGKITQHQRLNDEDRFGTDILCNLIFSFRADRFTSCFESHRLTILVYWRD